VTFSTFEPAEISNKFKYLGEEGGGDNLEVRTLGGVATSITYVSVQVGRGLENQLILSVFSFRLAPYHCF